MPPAVVPSSVRPDGTAGTTLAALALLTGAEPPPGSADVVVHGVTLDSAAVRPGDLYAALPGSRWHGADFTADAVRAGAVAVLTDPAGRERLAAAGHPLPTLVVEQPRAVLGAVSDEVFGHPSRDLLMLGVTGTNGKTTTTHLMDAVLSAAGRSTGLIGTVETRIAGRRLPSVRTTPEAPDLHAVLAVMRERGVQACSMEVSSQALAQHRVDCAVMDVAGFTNFTQDHLDLHGDMATYLAAKELLLTPAHCRQAVVVVDDEGTRLAASRAGVPVTTLSGDPRSGADWVVAEQVPAGSGSDVVLAGPHGARLALHCPLPGAFNVLNAALAAVVLLQAGLPAEQIGAGLAAMPGVPGRMERVGWPGDVPGPMALVDYAHTADAVSTVLAALRPTVAGRLVVVLGAGGDRDRGKRGPMGAAAARGADVVVVTDDNPRGEDPATVRAAVLAGARAAGTAAEVVEVGDRRAAIRAAVRMLGAGDVLLVAGKGHEQGQEVAGVVHPFDDRTELAAALAEQGSTDGSQDEVLHP